jgi:hydroxymethylglutaryl-CoA reductase (NADPH)
MFGRLARSTGRVVKSSTLLSNSNKEKIIFTRSNRFKTATATATAEKKRIVNPEAVCEVEKRPIDAKLTNEEVRVKTDGEILDLLLKKRLNHYELEERLGTENSDRAVKIRRMFFASQVPEQSLDGLPHDHYDFSRVTGVCCENVVGYVPIPVGIVGPLRIDDKDYFVPMATVEGCLVASTHRGCKALGKGSGVNAVLLNDGMTRGPCVQMPTARRSADLKEWLEHPENYSKCVQAFNNTSRFARLQEIKLGISGRTVFLRFKCTTGDAMGMNMISKATQKVLELLKQEFEDMSVVSLSGNYCTDKKPSAMNWIDGRGKSIVCDAVIPKDVVKSVLKTNVDDIVQLNISKNLIGSAMSGSIGGYNAHASNIVTAIFLATGQDCAQNVESSNCMTLMEKTPNGDLYMSCTMPSIEVGTIGGGTGLGPQSACLQMLGVKGTSEELGAGHNAQTLAKVVCATVMAGELSLMSALAADHLVQSHIKFNRAKPK